MVLFVYIVVLLWVLIAPIGVLWLKASMLISGRQALESSALLSGTRRSAQRLIAFQLCEPALSLAAVTCLCQVLVAPRGHGLAELFVNGVPDLADALVVGAPIALSAFVPRLWINSADRSLAKIAGTLVILGAARWACGILVLMSGGYGAAMFLSLGVQWRFWVWARGALARLTVRESLETGPPPREGDGYYVPPAL